MNNNKMCGIYKITNMVNGKAYIGQAQNIEKRWNEHIHYTKNKNSLAYTKPLYKAMRKYGVENFSFEILILCEEELLNLMEIYYIEKYNSYIHAENSNGYNLTLGGEGTRGYVFSEEHKKKISENAKLRVGEKNPFYGKHHTEEARQRMSEIKKDKYCGENNPMYGRKGIESPAYGRHLSEETKKRMSEERKGEKNPMYGKTGEKAYWYGKHHTEETRQKMSEKAKLRTYGNSSSAKKTYCDGFIFSCGKECAEYYSVKPKTMRAWLQGRNSMPQKFKELGLRYATEEDIKNYPTYVNINQN